MNIEDRFIKNIEFSFFDKVRKENRTLNIVEHDKIDLVYTKEEDESINVFGEVLKIGVNNINTADGNKEKQLYIVVVSYDYYSIANLHHIPLNSINTIININHAIKPCGFSNVICADESVVLVRIGNDGFEYTDDGRLWKGVNGSGTGTGNSGITADEVNNIVNDKINNKTKYTGKATVNVGGIAAGTSFVNKNITEVINDILNPYCKPRISLTLEPNTFLYEKGTSTSDIILKSHITKTSEDITKIELFVNNEMKQLLNTPSQIEDDKVYTYNCGKFNKNAIFKVVAYDKRSNNESTTSIEFVVPCYYGIINRDITKDNIKYTDFVSLNKRLSKSKEFTYTNINMTNKKLLYAYPSSYGDITSIKDNNGFNYLSGYDKVVIDEWNIYIAKNTGTLSNGIMKYT